MEPLDVRTIRCRCDRHQEMLPRGRLQFDKDGEFFVGGFRAASAAATRCARRQAAACASRAWFFSINSRSVCSPQVCGHTAETSQLEWLTT